MVELELSTWTPFGNFDSPSGLGTFSSPSSCFMMKQGSWGCLWLGTWEMNYWKSCSQGRLMSLEVYTYWVYVFNCPILTEVQVSVFPILSLDQIWIIELPFSHLNRIQSFLTKSLQELLNFLVSLYFAGHLADWIVWKTKNFALGGAYFLLGRKTPHL